MTDGVPSLLLPERLDTLAALGLAGPVRSFLEKSAGTMALDAAVVGEAGIVALQLLAAARLWAGQHGKSLGLMRCSAAMTAAIGDAGMVALLTADAPVSVPGGRALDLRFDDEALRFGAEPLERLRALRALGCAPCALLSGDDPQAMLAEPDHLAISFRIHVPDHVEDGRVEEILSSPGARFAWERPARHVVIEGGSSLLPVPQERIDGIVSLVGDLIANQATLVERMGGQRALLATELADLDRTVGALRDGIMGIARCRLDNLLSNLPGFDPALLSGGEVEVDRALFGRLAAPLAALLRDCGANGPVAIRAARDGAHVVLGIVTDRPVAESVMLRDLARRLGGRGLRSADGCSVELHLPPSLTQVEVILAETGAAAHAVPVSQLIEVMRPTANIVHALGAGGFMLRFRERFIPVVRLGERFDLDGWETDPLRAVLLVVHAGDSVVALQADAIREQRQVTVRPLGEGMEPPPGIQGAAIISASRIALVLDLAALEPMGEEAPFP